jgi:hypothetical protein
MSFTSSDAVSSYGKGDAKMGINRKSRDLDNQNAEYLENMQQEREAQVAQKFEQEQRVNQIMVQQSNALKTMGTQAAG